MSDNQAPAGELLLLERMRRCVEAQETDHYLRQLAEDLRLQEAADIKGPIRLWPVVRNRYEPVRHRRR